MENRFVLEVLNPRNAMKLEECRGLTAPRLTTLEGKRIAIVSEKPDGCLYLAQLQKRLRERHPASAVDILNGYIFKPEILLDRLKDYDAFIYGVRNTAAFNTEPAIVYEKAGIPGVHLCVGDNLYGQTKRNTLVFGLPGLRMIRLPAERWPGEEETENFVKLVDATVEEIEGALTAPLTEEEKHPVPPVFDTGLLRFEGADYDEAFEKFQSHFFERGYTDGMAVAPPTPEAVKRMLTGTSRDPAEVLPGTMTPGYGVVTIEKIAANAVMAGAKPEYLPVIITAVEMLCDEHYCAFHVIATVCSTSLLIQVSGPIAREIGMNSGFGYLGPGNRAASAIGRAVSLCCINLGWMDFSIDGGMKGQPSRYCNLIFTENGEYSPWEPFHVSMGYAPEDSTVMIDEILHVDGDWPFEITRMPSSTWTYGWRADLDRMAERAVGALPSALESAVREVHDIHKLGGGGTDAFGLISGRNYILVVYPGQARELAEKGFTRESLARYIGDCHRFPWDELSSELRASVLETAKSGRIPGLGPDDCKPGGTVPIFDTNRLAILVAGPLQGQTVGMTSMGGYGGIQAPVPFDKPPQRPFFLKKITGATLTRAGR
jgi:hypothetical protein